MNHTKSRRLVSLLLAFLLTLSLLPATALASGETGATVYVTVSDAGTIPDSKDGEPMAHVPVTVTGSSPTVDDVLTALHDAYYDGGAAAGYATEYNETYQSTSMTMLWGRTEGVGGFYVNGSMPMTSVDATPVNGGDVIDVVIYRPDWSDCYACFDRRTLTVGTGESFDLTLSYQYYGADYSVNTAALSNAAVRVDGAATGDATDADGGVSLSFAAAGTYVVSAVGPDGTNITAPACVVTAVAPVTVTVGAQQGGAFLYVSKELSVAYGTASSYGFANDASAGDAVTALDALVAAHADKYGASFTAETAADYLSVSYGSPSEMFGNGNTSLYSGFAVNHAYPMDASGNGYTANGAPLSSGDTVEFFYYEDPYWGDYLTWFADASGRKLDSVNVEAGESFTLYLRGFMYMSGYTSPAAEAVYNGEGGLGVYTVTDGSPDSAAAAAVTEDTGAIGLSFAASGTYYICAMGETEYGFRVVMPYCRVVVGEDGSITENEADDISVNGLSLTPSFGSETYSYTLPDQPYGKASVGFKVAASAGSAVSASNNGAAPVSITPGAATWKNVSLTAGTSRIAVTVTPAASTGALPKTYTVAVKRAVALKDLAVSLTGGAAVGLNETVSATTYAYTATALTGSGIVLSPSADGDAAHTAFTVNGAAAAASYAVAAGANVFTIRAVSEDGTAGTDYTLTVTGVSPASCAFAVNTAGAVLSLYDSHGVRVEPSSGTSFEGLRSGEVYTYTASKYGFIAEHGTITAGTDTAREITLASAPANALPQPAAQWADFRNSGVNMAVVSSGTPRSAAEAHEKWITSSSLNSGWLYPSPMLLVGDSVVVTGGTTLYKLDKETGATVATGTMSDSDGLSGYAAPVYAEGMILVPLKNGTVQAFSAATLESLWISESLGTQCATPLAYSGGYVYGSTGNAAPAKFFCLSVTDEDPSSPDEIKYATWTASSETYEKGSYWSGPVVAGGAVIYGTDARDGTSGLFSRNKYTGALISELTLADLGNQRSSIAYANGKIYFTTQGGYLCSATVGADGTLSGLTSVLNEGVTSSSSTPVVYGGVVYYGANGRLVAADAATLHTLREAAFPSAGAVQSSALLTTAYAASENGAVYLYLTQNASPGCIYVVRDTGSALALSALYTPASENYCIASIICDGDGTLYYRNDAGYIIAVETKDLDGCPVSFSVVPGDAAVTVAGKTAIAGNSYDLAAGTYSYTVSKTGYIEKTGSFTVTDAEAANHTARTIPVSLASDPGSGGTTPPDISVRVFVKTHDASACNNSYTYRHNASAYSNLAAETVSVPSGSTVFDALDAALSAAGIGYTEGSYGYISEIGGLSEFDHGPKSGWLYMVNGKTAEVGCRDYTLSSTATVIWFYTDDYTNEYGSENWSGGASGSSSDGIVLTPDVTGGAASASVTSKQVSDAIAAAKESGADHITIELETDEDIASAGITIKKSDLGSIAADTGVSLTVNTPVGTLEIPGGALASVAQQAGGANVEITVERKTDAQIDELIKNTDGLTAGDAKDAVVIQVGIASGGVPITRFGEGNTVRLDLPVDDSYSEGDTRKVIVVSGDGTVETFSARIVRKNGKLVAELELEHLTTFIVTHEPAVRFTDLDEGAWYYGAVVSTAGSGLFNGTSDTAFEPGACMTRAMLVTVLYRLEGKPAVTGGNAFTDVEAGRWYADAAAWAGENGIVNGCGGGLFGGNDRVTRQQLAVILLRYANYKKYDTSGAGDLAAYSDAGEIADWALGAMKWASAEGLMKGTSASTLDPRGGVTRAQAAAVLMRFAEYAEK